MAYEIVWAAEADNDCRVIITYLTEKWSLQVAEKFAVGNLKSDLYFLGINLINNPGPSVSA